MKGFWLEKAECTGCAACQNACPVDALVMEPDMCGFAYPHINDACIDCNRCEQVCEKRLELPPINDEPPTYASWSKNADVRFESTSGGAFTELAAPVIERGGAVIGAAYNKHNVIMHTLVKDMAGLAKIRQSKYAQSVIGGVFRLVKKELEQGNEVLFCGCPCQVAGLKAYLNKEWDSLLCIDFICRGVNSPKAFASWLDEVSMRQNERIDRVWFKFKKNGWKLSPRCTQIRFANGETCVYDQQENLFMVGYLEANLYMRPSCSQCKFKGSSRRSDITLGDFWGLSKELDDDKGASLVLVNTPKGEEAFLRARDSLVVNEHTFDEILGGNVCFESSVIINPKSEQFFANLDSMPFSEALHKSFNKSILSRVKHKIKSLMG